MGSNGRPDSSVQWAQYVKERHVLHWLLHVGFRWGRGKKNRTIEADWGEWRGK